MTVTPPSAVWTPATGPDGATAEAGAAEAEDGGDYFFGIIAALIAAAAGAAAGAATG